MSNLDKNGNHYGIFVGINRYQSNAIKPLTGCVNDATEMYDSLTNEQVGTIKNGNAILMLDEQAKKIDVMRQVEEMVSKLGTNDTLLVYWSCHGTRPDNDKGELYLITHDTDWQNGQLINVIKFIEELVPIFQQKRGNYVKVIVDGCEVGDALARPIISNNEHIGIMSASKREEQALEDQELKHGVFTYHLLQTLKSPTVDTDRDGYISMEEALIVTYPSVVSYIAQKFPGHPQHPTIAGHNVHRMFLTKQVSS